MKLSQRQGEQLHRTRAVLAITRANDMRSQHLPEQLRSQPGLFPLQTVTEVDNIGKEMLILERFASQSFYELRVGGSAMCISRLGEVNMLKIVEE